MEKYKFQKQATNIIKNMLEKTKIEPAIDQEKIGDIKIMNRHCKVAHCHLFCSSTL